MVAGEIQSIIAGKLWQQEYMTGDHLSFTHRKQRGGGGIGSGSGGKTSKLASQELLPQ